MTEKGHRMTEKIRKHLEKILQADIAKQDMIEQKLLTELTAIAGKEYTDIVKQELKDKRNEYARGHYLELLISIKEAILAGIKPMIALKWAQEEIGLHKIRAIIAMVR